MKKQLLIVLILIIAAGCGSQNKPGDEKSPSEFTGKGKIISIDTEKNTATIDHGEIKGLMGAMTMTFTAKDKKLLEGVGTGDSVDFTLQKDGEDHLLTTLKVTAKSLVNGAEIYSQSCAKCHGDKGEGAKKGIPLIEGHALGHPKEDFLKQVKEGGEKMPSFADKLTEDQIEAVVNFVRDDIQKGLRKEAGAGHDH